MRDAIIGAFEASMTEVDLVVPYDAGSAIGEVHKVHVISESYEEDGVHYRVQGPGVRDRADTGDAALECAAVPRGGNVETIGLVTRSRGIPDSAHPGSGRHVRRLPRQDRREGWQALVRRRRSRGVGRRAGGVALEADARLGHEAVGEDEAGEVRHE